MWTKHLANTRIQTGEGVRVRACAQEPEHACQSACGRRRGVYSVCGMCGQPGNGESSVQGVDSCDFSPELQLLRFFIYVTTEPEDVTHRGQSQAEAPGPEPT